MCLIGTTRFCLICLLVYLWLPQVTPMTTAKVDTKIDGHVTGKHENHAVIDGDTDAGGQKFSTDGDTVHHNHDGHEMHEKSDHDSPSKTSTNNLTSHEHMSHEHDHEHNHEPEHDHDHEHDHEQKEIVEHAYIDEMGHKITPGTHMRSILSRFGNGVNITFEGFEHLLKRLGLGGVVIDHSEECHKVENSSDFVQFHGGHNHTGDSINTPKSKSCYQVRTFDRSHGDSAVEHNHNGEEDHKHAHDDNEHSDHVHEHGNHTHGDNEHSDHVDAHGDHMHGDSEHPDEGHAHGQHSHDSSKSAPECVPKELMLNFVGGSEFMDVTESMFLEMCPSLVYQVAMDTCNTHHHDHAHDDHQLHDGHHDHDDHSHTQFYSSFADIPLKVWGFSSIAVVIISLVGLLGVAVIPIMQKVFYNHMLQFLVAMAVGALSGDALLHLLPHAIQGGHGSSSGHTEEDEHGHDDSGIYKGLCGLLGIYIFFLIERVLTIFTETKRRKKKSKNQRKHLGDAVGEKLATSENECGEMMMSIHPNKALKGYAEQAHDEHCTISLENTTAVSHQHGHSHLNHNHHGSEVDAEENETMLSHQSNGRAHGHSHCHGDGVPNSVTAIAWMVIMGDGIHNFSDGLAIGAAFSNSITGGFSTSIAVFCHELPHEMGDFAMLLRAGMKAKQAVLYNCLSSLLCFIGMLIGVAIGNLENASLWIFAVVGGMFLYIALVDMLPEMTSVEPKQGENPFSHLILQCIGMMIGAGIMLVIAVYEEQLKTVLD